MTQVRRPSVLIVEGEADLLLIACGMVEESGLLPVPCATGQGAHDHLAAHAADVRALFADITLSDPIDGLAPALATAERCPWIGICVTSGQSEARPEVLPRRVRRNPKPWRAVEVLAFVEGAADA